MRAVIQRVNHASVTVANEVISKIGKGLMVLIGIERNDTKEDMEYISRKVLNTKIFDEETKYWNVSVKDKNYEILFVSQFTLYHKFKGNKLDFHCAMKTEEARAFFDEFVNFTKNEYAADKIQTGEFGAMMKVDLENDGPVTIIVDSKNRNTV
ncbi:hypothetical protein ABK040_008970 [Willaertia magna]